MKIITLSSGEGAGGLRRDAQVSPHVLQRQRRRLRRRAVVGIEMPPTGWKLGIVFLT